MSKRYDSLNEVYKCETVLSNILDQQYYRQSVAQRRRTFEWQALSGRLIFALVMLTVLSGLIYSGFQFYYSIQEIKFRRDIFLQREKNFASRVELVKTLGPEVALNPDIPALQNSSTEAEFSMEKVRINSSLVGVIILVISIAFFFLYLHFVYPINILNEKQMDPEFLNKATTHMPVRP